MLQVHEVLVLCNKMIKLLNKINELMHTPEDNDVIFFKKQFADESEKLAIILEDELGETYFQVRSNFIHNELHSTTKKLKHLIQLTIVQWYKFMQRSSFVTRAFHLIRYAEHDDANIQHRIKLRNEQFAQKIKNGYTQAPRISNGIGVEALDDALAASFLPNDIHPELRTKEHIEQAQKEFRAWLDREHIFDEEMVNEFDIYQICWNYICILNEYTAPVVNSNILVLHLTRSLPTITTVVKSNIIDVDEFRSVNQYSMEKYLMMFTVDEFHEGMLKTPIKEMNLLQILWLFQWLRTMHWYLPFSDRHWLKYLNLFLVRVSEVCHFAHPYESMVVAQYCSVYDVREVPGRSLVRPKPNNFSIRDYFASLCEIQDTESLYHKEKCKWYVTNQYINRVIMLTIRGIWTICHEMADFPEPRPIRVNNEQLISIRQFFQDTANTIFFSQDQTMRMMADITSSYASFGCSAVYRMNYPTRDNTPAFFVPEQYGGRVFNNISSTFQSSLSQIIANTEIAQHLRLIVLIHILECFFINNSVMNFMRDCVFFSDRATLSFINVAYDTEEKRTPMLVQIGNTFNVSFKGVLYTTEKADELLLFFFELIAHENNAVMCYCNIASILTSMGIQSNVVNSNDRLNEFLENHLYRQIE